jgi:hypothetical protein
MKKLTLLLLLMISTSVFAEWTEVSSDGANMTGYVDLGTIKKKGHKVKMWSLSDFKTVQISKADNTRYLSSVSHYEYDCEEETGRQLDIYWYSSNMRRGEIVYSVPNIKDEAGSIIPDSIGEIDFKIACSKK